MTSIFNTSWEYPRVHVWYKLSDCSLNLWRVIARKTKFLRILSQKSQNDLKGQSQWPLFSIPAKSIPECMFGANLVILAQIYDELLCGQAGFPRILSQNGQNDLEGQGQWPLFAIPAKSISWYMFGANLVIPAQICDELSCRQGKVYRQTDRPTDRRRQRQYPFGLKGLGGKNISSAVTNILCQLTTITPKLTCKGKTPTAISCRSGCRICVSVVLGVDQVTSHYLNQWWLDYQCIYASLSLNELILVLYIPSA